MQHPFSQNMVAGFNDGNGLMVTRLIESYYPEILKRVKQLTKGSPDAIDLASDTMTILLGHKRPFETVKNIKNYIETVIVRICRDDLRRKNFRKRNTDNLAAHYINSEEKAMKNANTREMFKQLQYLATEMLSPQCKQVFHLYYVEEMKNKAIAAQLGISEKTVEYHKNFAIKKLRIGINGGAGGGRAMFLLLISFPLFVFYLLIQKLFS